MGGQLREEVRAWHRAYIDINLLVKEGRELRRDAEEARGQVEELRGRVSSLETSKTYMEDTTRWVEGSSDKERQEELVDNYRSVNTVVIAVNEEPQVQRRRRFPAVGREAPAATSTDTSEDSDKSSFSEKQEEAAVQRVDV